jgi:hypothetical protein
VLCLNHDATSARSIRNLSSAEHASLAAFAQNPDYAEAAEEQHHGFLGECGSEKAGRS